MTTLSKPTPGELWLAYVEFSDHPGIGKVRPVFILEVEDDRCIALAAKVTSKDYRENGADECIPIINWGKHGLRKPSYIRLDQKLELALENLVSEEPLGRLPKTFLEQVKTLLN